MVKTLSLGYVYFTTIFLNSWVAAKVELRGKFILFVIGQTELLASNKEYTIKVMKCHFLN